MILGIPPSFDPPVRLVRATLSGAESHDDYPLECNHALFKCKYILKGGHQNDQLS